MGRNEANARDTDIPVCSLTTGDTHQIRHVLEGEHLGFRAGEEMAAVAIHGLHRGRTAGKERSDTFNIEEPEGSVKAKLDEIFLTAARVDISNAGASCGQLRFAKTGRRVLELRVCP